MNKNLLKENNFDLIRLFAASQVVLFNHYATYFQISSLKGTMMTAFPGVPIFFMISGFLISLSFENNNNLKDYFRNRVLRIFPAFWICVILGILSVFISGYPIDLNLKTLIWSISQFIYPVYNPSFMREYGVGVLNGSLWTIPVEFEFYLILPILYYLLIKKHNCLKEVSLIFGIYFASKIIINLVWPEVDKKTPFGNSPLSFKMWNATVLPYLFAFCIGILFQRNFNFFYRILHGKFLITLPIYLVFYWILKHTNQQPSFLCGIWQLPLYLTLGCVIFSGAYTCTKLSEKLLKGNDISYGIYIFHMPIANFIIYNLGGGIQNFCIAITITYAVAFASWKLIERPALKLKHHQFFKRN